MHNINKNQPNHKDNENYSDKKLLNFNNYRWENNIYTFHKIDHKKSILKAKTTKKIITEHEIFLCVLITIILGIHIGGNTLIQYRTKQKIIDSSIPQISTNLNDK